MPDFFVFTMITKTRPWRHIYHDIEIPRPKKHDIEIPRPKSHDIEIPTIIIIIFTFIHNRKRFFKLYLHITT